MAKKSFNNAAMNFITAAEEPATTQEGFTVPKGYKLVQESKTARTQILLRPTTKEALKAEADAQGISLNELVNKIIDNYLSGKGNA